MVWNKTNWKFLTIIVILGIVVSGGVLWLSKQQISPQFPEIKKPKEIAKDKIVESEKSTEAIYSMIELSPLIKKKLKNYLLYEKGMKELEKTRPGITESLVSDSFGFSYKNNKYVVSFDYTGGAHCCFRWFVLRVDENNSLEYIPTNTPIVPIGNFYPQGEENLIEKNGKLYLSSIDDRFSYFCGTYASSPFFNRYFLIEKDKLILSNTDFKKEFINKAIEAENKLWKFYEEVKATSKEEIEKRSYSFEYWCPFLVERTVNYIVAREDSKAWENWDEIFDKFSSLSPSLIKWNTSIANSKNVREKILEYMNSFLY